MKAVLLLIDLQEDFLRGASCLLPSRELLIRRVARLLTAFREHQLPVIHVWTTVKPDGGHRFAHWPRNAVKCLLGSSGHQPPAMLRPTDDEAIVHKQGFNPFTGSGLEMRLGDLSPQTVVIVGVHLHACVRTAAVECLERGYSAVVAEDAVGSSEPLHAAATQRWLAERRVRFVPVSGCLDELDGREVGVYAHRSPRAVDETCFTVRNAEVDEIRAAAAAAGRARGAWWGLPVETRRERLLQVATLLRLRATGLAKRMAVEIGKPVSHGLEEVQRAAGNIDDVVSRVGEVAGKAPCQAPVRGCPLGVVAIITPWNNPVALPIGKIVPALAYGNAVVWKPAPAATGLARELVKLLDEARIPRELVAMVEGDGATARSLAGLESIDGVTITGSLAAGYAMQEICGYRSVPLQAELGGNNAAIVWEEASLEDAATQIAWGALAFAGQRCTANRRAIVCRQQTERFLDLAQAAASRLVWGDPLEPMTDIGPILNADRCAEMEALLADAQAKGHVQALVHPHAVPRPQASGSSPAYARPTIVVCAEASHTLVQDETMSPLLVVQPADDFEHALALCNGVRQGLVAALFSQSASLRARFLKEAQAGILKLNSSTAGADPSLPFGGWKASGLGPPEHGESDARFYQRLQVVYGQVEEAAPCRELHGTKAARSSTNL